MTAKLVASVREKSLSLYCLDDISCSLFIGNVDALDPYGAFIYAVKESGGGSMPKLIEDKRMCFGDEEIRRYQVYASASYLLGNPPGCVVVVVSPIE